MTIIAASTKFAKPMQIQEQSLFLETLLANLSGVAYRCRNDWNWSMQFVSPGAESLCGYEADDLMRDNPCWGDIINPEDRFSVWETVQAELARNSAFEIEYRIITRSGTSLWVLEKGRMAASDEGDMMIDGYIVDITPFKRQQQVLEHSEANFKAIVSTAVDGIITIDTKGRIWTFNRAAEDLLGYNVREVTGKDVRVLLYESCGTKDDRQLCDFFNTDKGQQEVTVRRKDGTLVPVDLSASQISVDGQLHFACMLHDLSAQKIVEETLRQEHERLTVTIEHAPMGIASYRFGETLVSVNRAFCEITGYALEELHSMTVQDLTHPDDWAAAAVLAEQANAGEIDRFSHRKRYVRKDGSVIDVEVVNSVTHDSCGRPDLVIAHVEDLTPRLRAEAEAREHREKLAHIDRLNTLGQMASGIAHEINQPLTAISLFGQAGKRLLETGKEDRLPDIFDKISQHALRAGAVIERMQKLVKQHESVNEIVDCNLLIEEVCQLAEAEARIRDMIIELEMSDQLPLVAIDTVQIQQVVLNLLRNGMEAMQSEQCYGIDTIKLQTRQRDDGDIEVAVIDSGCGVSPDVAKQLFEPFSTTKESGMGMGLSICQRIITAHGGQLGFHNNRSRGATFWFTLPTIEQEDHCG